jgi:signal transduction histidine kinase
MASLDRSRHNTKLPDEARQFAAQALQELARVSQVTTQTLRFFRQSTAQQRVRLSDVLESVLALYQGRLLNSNIAVERRFRDPAILCFEGELRQVLNNLVGNAVDALREDFGGRLLVRARAATEWSTGHKGVQLTVADTGHGMDRKTQSRIFEAFFSTKGIGGTGLGLWVSTDVVRKHQGKLRVRSRERAPHRGTVFTVFIPDQE